MRTDPTPAVKANMATDMIRVTGQQAVWHLAEGWGGWLWCSDKERAWLGWRAGGCGKMAGGCRKGWWPGFCLELP